MDLRNTFLCEKYRYSSASGAFQNSRYKRPLVWENCQKQEICSGSRSDLFFVVWSSRRIWHIGPCLWFWKLSACDWLDWMLHWETGDRAVLRVMIMARRSTVNISGFVHLMRYLGNDDSGNWSCVRSRWIAWEWDSKLGMVKWLADSVVTRRLYSQKPPSFSTPFQVSQAWTGYLSCS